MLLLIGWLGVARRAQPRPDLSKIVRGWLSLVWGWYGYIKKCWKWKINEIPGKWKCFFFSTNVLPNILSHWLNNDEILNECRGYSILLLCLPYSVWPSNSVNIKLAYIGHWKGLTPSKQVFEWEAMNWKITRVFYFKFLENKG